MSEVHEAAAVASEDVLARSAKEAERKAFDAASASLIEGPRQVLFADEIEADPGTGTKSGENPTTIEDGRCPFRHRGL